MEVFRSELYYIFVKNESSLWWNRLSGAFSVRSGKELLIDDIYIYFIEKFRKLNITII